ncbi:hypothetical protein N836_05680 [Leptolyngbya sp. Heron Island J]|nr:hypothetical protein N836_05680 [Leptolyngbya sp. Heron Island J]
MMTGLNNQQTRRNETLLASFCGFKFGGIRLKLPLEKSGLQPK